MEGQSRMEKNKFTVAINSRQYTLVSAETPEYMKGLADHINEKIDYVRKYSDNVMGERPIILAALNICDEYFKTIQATITLNEQMERMNQKNEELSAENKKLKAAAKAADGAGSVDALQKQIIDYADEITKLKSKLKQAQKSEKEKGAEVKRMTDSHKKELEALRREYEAKEQEMLHMIDKM